MCVTVKGRLSLKLSGSIIIHVFHGATRIRDGIWDEFSYGREPKVKRITMGGRNRGFRVWPGDWLTKEKLITIDARPENFYVGKIGIHIVCTFILQWNDSEYWNNAQKNEAVYLHKFCVRREFAGRNMTKSVIEAIRKLCKEKGIKYIYI